MKDLVLGIDSSTQSTKAIAWTKNGQAVAEGRAAIKLSNPSFAHFEQDPEDWWRACCTAIKDLGQKIDLQRIAGIAIANQRETVGFIGEKGETIRPAIVWMDERARAQVATLAKKLGADKIHRLTGKPPDLIPVLYRLEWLRENEPANFARTRCFVDVHTYLVYRLTQTFASSWGSCDPMGYFDIQKKAWSAELLAEIKLTAERLPETYAPGRQMGEVSVQAAQETALSAGIPIFAGAGDGQCAALGVNSVSTRTIYINLGTAVVAGIRLEEYIVDKAWRTLISADGGGYILETCVKCGAFLINWFVDQFMPLQRKQPDFFQNLEKKVRNIPLGSNGLMCLPYWSGVMNPYWDNQARGCFVGLSGGHTPTHMYRAILEGITLEQAMAIQLIEEATALKPEALLAIGGGTASALWVQMLADAINKKVGISTVTEASSLGAAMIAAAGVGWYPNILAAAANMSAEPQFIYPDQQVRPKWEQLLTIFKDIYPCNKKIFANLVALNTT